MKTIVLIISNVHNNSIGHNISISIGNSNNNQNNDDGGDRGGKKQPTCQSADGCVDQNSEGQMKWEL